MRDLLKLAKQSSGEYDANDNAHIGISPKNLTCAIDCIIKFSPIYTTIYKSIPSISTNKNRSLLDPKFMKKSA